MKKFIYSCVLLPAFLIVVFINCSRKIAGSSDLPAREYLQPEYTLNSRVPLSTSFYFPPVTANLENGRWLVYELHLSNYFTSDIRIDGVQVLSDTALKKYLYQSSEVQFRQQFKNLRKTEDSLSTTLQPGATGIIFFWLHIDNDAKVADSLYHRLLIQLLGRKMSLVLNAIPINKTSGIVLSPPVRGLWMVGQGVDPDVKSTEGHNRLLYPQFGRIRLPQRFASDFVMLGANNKVFEGDSSKNENYYAYGAEVYAVADGVITEIQNDVPENIPPEMTVPRTAKNVTGNYLVLKMKNGKSAYYGHLQTGSIKVAPGEKVRSGQVLAKVGNSGNSTGAHLHFQIQDGDHFFDEGYPFTFHSLVKYGRATKEQVDDMADRGHSFPGRMEPVELKNVLPAYGDIILFK